MLTEERILIPAKLRHRIRSLARDDEDLLREHRKEWERHCLRQHHRRIWEKLRPRERTFLKEQNGQCDEFTIIKEISVMLEQGSVWSLAGFDVSGQRSHSEE